MEWNLCKNGLPKKWGEYLVTVKMFTCDDYRLGLAYFAEDLYEVDAFDFPDKKNKAGFYEYDSEYGYYELTDVVAWMECPLPYNPYKEKMYVDDYNQKF